MAVILLDAAAAVTIDNADDNNGVEEPTANRENLESSCY
jgi:hypothetical protein